jgi:hypothetical protein
MKRQSTLPITLQLLRFCPTGLLLTPPPKSFETKYRCFPLLAGQHRRSFFEASLQGLGLLGCLVVMDLFIQRDRSYFVGTLFYSFFTFCQVFLRFLSVPTRKGQLYDSSKLCQGYNETNLAPIFNQFSPFSFDP